MPTIALQHYKRGAHYYASIIETFRDPVTRKNSSRTLEALGDISEKMKEDPNYLQSLKTESQLCARMPHVQNSSKRLRFGGLRPRFLILRQTPHLLGSITEWRPYEKSGRSLD